MKRVTKGWELPPSVAMKVELATPRLHIVVEHEGGGFSTVKLFLLGLKGARQALVVVRPKERDCWGHFRTYGAGEYGSKEEEALKKALEFLGVGLKRGGVGLRRFHIGGNFYKVSSSEVVEGSGGAAKE